MVKIFEIRYLLNRIKLITVGNCVNLEHFAAGVSATRAKRTGEAHPLLLLESLHKLRSSKDRAEDPVVAVKNETATSRPKRKRHLKIISYTKMKIELSDFNSSYKRGIPIINLTS